MEFSSGIRVENSCQNCNFSQIRMLGLQGPYTQILFDGQPTVSSLAQVYGIEQIPARMVERIEVVKGGGSSVYGPGSVGGVVNVITRVPSKVGGDLTGRAEWMDGTPGQSTSGAADWISQDRQSAVTIFGQLDKIHPVDVDEDGFSEVSKRDFKALGARYRQNLLEQRAQVDFDFNHFRELRRGGDRLDLPPHQAQLAEAVQTRRYAAGVNWHHTPNTKLDYRIGFSFAQTNRNSYYGSGMDPDAYGETRNPLWVVDSQFNHFFPSHVVSWRGQVTADMISDSFPRYDRSYEETYVDTGFFVQDDWFFLPDWELVYGMRADKHTAVDRIILSPRIALMWAAAPTLNFRTCVATGFLPPQVFTEDLHIEQAGGVAHVIRNSVDLREEHSTTVTAGVEWKPTWRRNVGIVEFNVFHTLIEDLSHIVEDNDPSTAQKEFSRVNYGKAKVYGAEINLGYALATSLELQIGYVWQRARFSEAEPDFRSKDFFRTPQGYGMATLIYRNPKLGEVFLGLHYTGDMKVPHYPGYILEKRLEATPAYWTVDASISRSFPIGSDSRLVFSLGGRNLTDYYQNDLDRGPNRDAGYVWGPRFPQTLYVSTAIEF